MKPDGHRDERFSVCLCPAAQRNEPSTATVFCRGPICLYISPVWHLMYKLIVKKQLFWSFHPSVHCLDSLFLCIILQPVERLSLHHSDSPTHSIIIITSCQSYDESILQYFKPSFTHVTKKSGILTHSHVFCQICNQSGTHTTALVNICFFILYHLLYFCTKAERNNMN